MSTFPRTLLGMIPTEAIARRVEAHDQSSCIEHLLEGRVALRVYPHEGSEIPAAAFSFDEAGRMHGLEREWHENGRLRYQARWRHGVQHGVARQWDPSGRLIARSVFVRGTGFDVYCGHGARVTETREMREGNRHGVERMWASATRVWSEGTYALGLEHGIFREWNEHGRMKRGFPRYYVRGARVERRAYVRATRSDPTLPPVVAREDRARRPRPVAITPADSAHRRAPPFDTPPRAPRLGRPERN